MQLGEPRPPSVIGHPPEWQSRSQFDAGPSTSSPPSSFVPPSTLAQRRRSSTINPPPQHPPPSQPIPNLPTLDSSAFAVDRYSFLEEDLPTAPTAHGRLGQFARPAASPGLAAVAAFSQMQARQAYSSQPHATSSIASNLMGPPPQPASRSPPTQHQIVPDRLLLSPSGETPTTASEPPRPSSRRALTKALELAREAVKLDSTNDDPEGAVIAYGKSVALLSRVMERVMRGEDTTEPQRRRGGRRRSVVAQEEEVRRLKAIHDTYADRMNILSLIYSIPPPQHSPVSAYPPSISASTDSTQPPSPTSGSPSSVSSDQFSSTPSGADDDLDIRRLSQETARYHGEINTNGHSTEAPSSYHPYAAAARISVAVDHTSDPPFQTSISTPTTSINRASVLPPARPLPSGPPPSRPRAASALPPPVPPPQNALPPAPDGATNKHLNVGNRPRVNSTGGHVRSGSNSRLESLREEGEKHEVHPLQSQQRPHFDVEEDLRARPRSIVHVQPRDTHRDSHPLPPLPPLSDTSGDDLVTPRTTANDHEPLSPPASAKFMPPRPRGTSTASVRSEMAPPPSSSALINSSTMMGTISQRRSKVSAPPSTGSPQMSESLPPSAMKLVGSGLPVTSTQPLQYTRSRASSQPGHRPNLTGLPPSSFDQSYPSRPPSTVQSAVPSSRKTSISSRNGSSLPQITVVTGYLSPSLSSSTPVSQLVPPPPIPHSNLPTTPISPLPPTAPADVMRKPYHMMNLLRHTMMSKSGGYITRRLHVPQEVWSQGGAKLSNLPEKVRVVEVLCSALEEVQVTSVDIFGAGNVSSGMAMGIGSIGKKEGEAWCLKLEEFSGVCDGVVANFGKKLGVGEGFVTKKTTGVTSWGGKLTRQFDKFTNQKNLDSPASYVQGLSKLFLQAQLLDEHARAISMQPLAPVYAALPPELRAAVETKLRRSSEFFATVVLTFVIRDTAQLLDKYVKKCEKWLAE
ncbi:hypothetical protein BV25DRAFT_1819378 [Artomyces pyxidatus]|uniref:Uncharacterized protein n=1 Tax=Artomyces pyxidatus TaxID=48021 RepID=A0ACB8THN6_9AGAM|nr:hypothetical protein BV25DRAFT_1819378 [Artomyces pyxidatus]